MFLAILAVCLSVCLAVHPSAHHISTNIGQIAMKFGSDMLPLGCTVIMWVIQHHHQTILLNLGWGTSGLQDRKTF